jgi:nitroreductase
MNSTLETIFNRRSVRSYANRLVSESEKDLILTAAMRAPTAGNMMLYTILDIEDQALKDRLAVTCDDQAFIASAPLVLVFLADYQRWYDYYRSGGVEAKCAERGQPMRLLGEGDLMLAACDALIAAHSSVIAAESLGIGSCYIGDILENYEIHRELLCLPRWVLPVAMVCFGYPASDPNERQQTTRFEREFIVQRDRYHRQSPEDLERMFAVRNAQMVTNGARRDGIENIAQFNYFKKFSAEFSVEMNRSVKVMIDSWVNGD